MNALEKILYVMIIFLPSIVLWIYINRFDKEKEPKKVLIKMFFSGVLAAIATILLSSIIDWIMPGFIEYETSSLSKMFVYIFLGIALIEEVTKWVAMILFGWKDSNLNSTYDIILYSMLIALGFATFENILYAINGDFISAIVRAFTAVPGHVIDGTFMGYYFYKSRLAGINSDLKAKKIYLSKAILIPTITHTIYDLLANFYDNTYVLIVFVVFILIEYIIAIKLIRRMSKNSRKIQ